MHAEKEQLHDYLSQGYYDNMNKTSYAGPQCHQDSQLSAIQMSIVTYVSRLQRNNRLAN